jgi:hypothetical protein
MREPRTTPPTSPSEARAPTPPEAAAGAPEAAAWEAGAPGPSETPLDLLADLTVQGDERAAPPAPFRLEG